MAIVAQHRNHWTLAAISGAIILTVAGGIAWAATSRADDPSDTFTRAATAGAQAGDSPAAIVNGETITRATLAEVQTQLQTFPAQGIDASNQTSVLDYLIRGALIRQEAARRGLLPTDAEVTAAITETQRGYKQDLAAGKLPPVMVNILDGEAKVGHPLDSWTTDPVIRSAWRSMLTQAKLAADQASDIPAGTNNIAQLTQQRLDQLVQRLRDAAQIQILIK